MAGSVEDVGEQRRAHERMTAEQFVWWLRGFLDSGSVAAHGLPVADVTAVRAALGRVGPYAAPPAPPAPSLDQIKRQLHSRCPRCDQHLSSLGGAHFCNGVLNNG